MKVAASVNGTAPISSPATSPSSATVVDDSAEEIGKGPPPSSSSSISSPKVRLVPIRLADGSYLRREPDQTMEVRTEFTRYEKTEFAEANEDDASGRWVLAFEVPFAYANLCRELSRV